MLNNLKNYLYQAKSKIGFGHGSIVVFGSIILSYLTMMLYSKYMFGDYGVKIVPSMILTPLLMSAFSFWLLFSKTIMQSIQKFFLTSLLFIIILKILT